MARLQDNGHISFPKAMNPRINKFLESDRVRLIGSGGSGGNRAFLFEIVP